eukprot:6203828-Pleurochrysis_carterae.AAC.2
MTAAGRHAHSDPKLRLGGDLHGAGDCNYQASAHQSSVLWAGHSGQAVRTTFVTISASLSSGRFSNFRPSSVASAARTGVNTAVAPEVSRAPCTARVIACLREKPIRTPGAAPRVITADTQGSSASASKCGVILSGQLQRGVGEDDERLGGVVE